ncbi:MAG: serine hydrolase [Absicoccus porci]|uniref:serine hydrolase n=1 Tax=Absicoccus porci TaxID=2486576 RepID=UPI002E787C0E|nr:serine hydrolase [Absicoccus porci]MEE1354798.1 serine hydrolase [Absicoccus porci]
MKKLCISIVLCFSLCLSTPIQEYTNKIQTIGQKSEKAEQVILKNGTGKKIKSLRIQKASNAKTSENYLKQSWKAKEKVKLSYVVDEKDQYNLKVGIGRTIYEIEDFAFRDKKLCLNDHTLYAVPNTMQELKNQINDYLDQHTNNGEDWSVYVQMVDDKKNYVNIHSHSQQAASVIKLFVMGAIYDNYNKVTAVYGKDVVDQNLTEMITISSNDAWTNLVNMLGNDDYAQGDQIVTNWAKIHGYIDTSTCDDLGENYTSVKDAAHVIYDIYHQKLPYSNEMLALLKQQTRTTKIPASIPDGIVTGNKTGELDDTENDVAIIYGKDHTYILSVMATNLSSTENAQQMIRDISTIVYGYLNP